MKLTARFVDAFVSGYVATLDPADAILLGVKENDRVRVIGPKGEMAVVAIVSDNFVKPGQVLLSTPLLHRIGASDGIEVDVLYSPTPESVLSIRRTRMASPWR